MLLSSLQMIADGRLLVWQERAAKTEVHGSCEVSSMKEMFVTTTGRLWVFAVPGKSLGVRLAHWGLPLSKEMLGLQRR